MIANTTIAHLSACKHILRDQALKLAREKIRLNMGVLKALGDIWPLAERTYREVGVIAREILCLVEQDVVAPADYSVTDLTFYSSNLSNLDLNSAVDVADCLGFEQTVF